ncbi:MAG TPA: hypothetical protein VHT02_09500 [Methylocella sp.]|jgi:hypothetical protein|nr:hypothetical protein [Methylocella sp.]
MFPKVVQRPLVFGKEELEPIGAGNGTHPGDRACARRSRVTAAALCGIELRELCGDLDKRWVDLGHTGHST